MRTLQIGLTLYSTRYRNMEIQFRNKFILWIVRLSEYAMKANDFHSPDTSRVSYYANLY